MSGAIRSNPILLQIRDAVVRRVLARIVRATGRQLAPAEVGVVREEVLTGVKSAYVRGKIAHSDYTSVRDEIDEEITLEWKKRD